jgi:hypothetical protein
MSFSERARVAVFAPVAFVVCVAFAIFVVPFSRRGRHRVTLREPARLPRGKRAFSAMMSMTKIDVARIEAARRG